jgi:hypothetical protein
MNDTEDDPLAIRRCTASPTGWAWASSGKPCHNMNRVERELERERVETLPDADLLLLNGAVIGDRDLPGGHELRCELTQRLEDGRILTNELAAAVLVTGARAARKAKRARLHPTPEVNAPGARGLFS